jgi:hypothetical protein
VSVAVITFTYNESVNLPIWLSYYGGNFGYDSLYVVDRGSNDGSTDNLKGANLIRVPRSEFDEDQKTDFMTKLFGALLNFYDLVILTDCDEILVPDPRVASSLRDYVGSLDRPYVNAIGIDVIQMITMEGPIDFGKPILGQRRFGRFHSPSCKQLLSREALHWLPGFHTTNRPPVFDGNLYMFHLKCMDMSIAFRRQEINLATVWSEESVRKGYGRHHRFSIEQFVHQNFLVPVSLFAKGDFGEFAFQDLTDRIEKETEFAADHYYIPMNIARYATIPERFFGLL